MKKRSIMLGSAVLLAVLLVVGGTMAWFTAEAEPFVNTFTAGTVAISINDTFETEEAQNVNPGDTYEKIVSVTNNGSKRVYIRVKLTPLFNPANLDTDVVDFPISDDWTELQPDGYYYYKSIVYPGDDPLTNTTKNIIEEVIFAGEAMDNDYQGATFTLTVEAEAIQATNGAINDQWEFTDAKLQDLGIEILP